MSLEATLLLAVLLGWVSVAAAQGGQRSDRGSVFRK